MNHVEALLDEWLAGQPCASPSCDATTDDGQKCPECGTIPAVTRPELQAELEKDPLAADEIFAQRAIAEGTEMLDAAIAQLHEADRIRHMAVLRLARDLAQAKLNDYAQAHNQLAAERQPGIRKAERAELRARRDAEAADGRCEEIAARKGEAERYFRFDEELELGATLDRAGKIRDRYKAVHATTVSELEAARGPVKASEAVRKQLELRRDQAVTALNNPGRVGYGAESISLGLMRLLKGGRLSDEEQLLASQLAVDAVAASGLLDVVKAQVRAEVLAEQEQAARDKPLMRGHTADGQPVAIGNPYNTSTPQPYHPPAPVPAGGVTTSPPAAAPLGRAGMPG